MRASTLHKLSAKVPAFALPFVTRSLRGHRGRRYVALSAVLACLALLTSLWLARGTGPFERELRRELGMEDRLHTRQHEEFTVYIRDEARFERARQEVAEHRSDPLRPYEIAEIEGVAHRSRQLLWRFVRAQAITPRERELQARALELVKQDPTGGYPHEMVDPATLDQIELILAHDGLPQVRRYRSPLGVAEVLSFLGLISGFLLAGLATVIAPLLVAVVQAQERHENTLAPLVGTALRPRGLALGLAAGPLAVVTIFAAPQVLLFLAASVGLGEVALGLVIVAVLASLGAGMVLVTQLVAHLVGRRWIPGLIGTLLTGISGVLWLLGLALAVDSHPDTATAAALVPHMGLTELLIATFVSSSELQPQSFVAIGASSLGALVFGALALVALARKLEARAIALKPGEALVGAITAIALVNLAINWSADSVQRAYVGLVLLVLPLTLLAMARVPTGDGPTKLRRIPVIARLAEYGGWVAFHMVVAGRLASDPDCWHPIALVWLAWCVGVLGLLAIRLAATQGTIANNLWAAFCALSLLMGFGQAVGWASGDLDTIGHAFVATEYSPVLGLLQVALTAWIPISLVRHLQRNVGRLS